MGRTSRWCNTFHCDINNFKIKNGETEVAVLSEIVKSLNRLFTLIGGTDDGTDHWLTDAIRLDENADGEVDDLGIANDSDANWSL